MSSWFLYRSDNCIEHQQLGKMLIFDQIVFHPNCHAGYILSGALPYSNLNVQCHLEVTGITWYRGITPTATHHPSLSFTPGAGRCTLLFSLKTVFIGVAWLHIYFNDVHSVSFKLISRLIFCPLCI